MHRNVHPVRDRKANEHWTSCWCNLFSFLIMLVMTAHCALLFYFARFFFLPTFLYLWNIVKLLFCDISPVHPEGLNVPLGAAFSKEHEKGKCKWGCRSSWFHPCLSATSFYTKHIYLHKYHPWLITISNKSPHTWQLSLNMHHTPGQ